jgi:predicted AAA+ superfamily ATPase
MTPRFKNVTPHQDVRDGVLDESVFAADLSEVAIGKGRPVYAKPELFFSKTYFTAGLRTICKRVIDGLNGKIRACPMFMKNLDKCRTDTK